MTKAEKLEAFYDKKGPWRASLLKLRIYLKSTELEEDWKWSFPTYTLQGHNVVATASFKHHFGLWFFQGALLKDPYNKLHNAQEGKTKAMRQCHFESPEALEMNIIKDYINEAIKNATEGKKVKIQRVTKKVAMPIQLKNALLNDASLNNNFAALSLAKRREYCQYINEAKQEATKQRRLEKVLPLILDGKGLGTLWTK